MSAVINDLIGRIKKEPENYELYLEYGEYLKNINVDQAYLAFENALFLCEVTLGKNSVQANDIRAMISGFRSANDVKVRNVSFIILSYNLLDITRLCIESIRSTCFDESYEIVVVDNASNDGSVEWLREQEDVILVENNENSGFPKGCNQGIAAANPDNDIMLLNNDTIMLLNSLFCLRMGLYSDKRNGAAGSISNRVSNGQQIRIEGGELEDYMVFAADNNVPSLEPYESKSYLVMFAMLIKRDAFDEVGGLDERFSPGNFEDNDYGIRLMEKGYLSILCRNSFIFHFGSKSFGSDIEAYRALLERNAEKFKDKWGFYISYYSHPRNDTIRMMCSQSEDEINILDVGCGLGENLARIKYYYPNAKVHGIEIVESVASIAAKRFDIKCGDIEAMELSDEKYDYIFFNDVLEHLRYPDKVLEKIKSCLKKDGHLIASIPNLMNAEVIRKLLAGYFTYQDSGILDSTHLRFFTKNEVIRLFDSTGYDIESIEGNVLPESSTDIDSSFFDQLCAIDGVADRTNFDVFQFVVRVCKK